MKCPKCGGKGLYNHIADYYVRCNKCNGTGKIEQTEEEWFCSLPTEEKAKWLENKMTWAAQEQGTFTAKGWEMWLKQPHTDKK